MALSNTENTAIPPSYLSISDVEWVRAEDGTLQKNVCNSEGITRTSVLLCRRGWADRPADVRAEDHYKKQFN